MSNLFHGTGNVAMLGSMAAVRERRGWFIGLGLALILLGILAIFAPFAATLATTLFIGWLLVVGGIVHAIHAFQNRRWSGFPWALLAAALHIVAGGLVIAYPLAGTLTLTLILVGFFLANGFVKTVRALQHRDARSWGWLLFDGVLTLGLGVLLLVGWPGTAVWAIGLLVGIDMLVGGSSLLLLGVTAGSHAREARV